MGMPPHQFMTLRRIERAKQLLLRTDQSLAEIALEVGFSSQAHFTDQFRRVTGSTPLRFRTGTESSSICEPNEKTITGPRMSAAADALTRDRRM